MTAYAIVSIVLIVVGGSMLIAQTLIMTTRWEREDRLRRQQELERWYDNTYERTS